MQGAGNAGTPCAKCTNGTEQIENNVRREMIIQADGSLVPEDLCVACRAGWVDADDNASTPCTKCPPGTFSAPLSLQCSVCAAGFSDHDEDSATPCQICPGGRYATDAGRNGSCHACPFGTASPVIGSTTNDVCTACNVGEWTFFAGAPTCSACPVGSYRSALDTAGCVQCVTEADDKVQFLCDESNMSWPKASPGHYTNWWVKRFRGTPSQIRASAVHKRRRI